VDNFFHFIGEYDCILTRRLTKHDGQAFMKRRFGHPQKRKRQFSSKKPRSMMCAKKFPSTQNSINRTNVPSAKGNGFAREKEENHETEASARKIALTPSGK